MRSTEVVWRSTRDTRAALLEGLTICGAAAILLLPSLLHGPPTGHDYPIHRAWIEFFPDAMGLTDPYPRWLGALWFGAGGADFYFYPPLTYCLAGALQALFRGSLSPDSLILAVGVVTLAQSGLGFRALGQRYARRGPALVAALVYMGLPYHLGADWYQRLALAEFVAMAVLPWHLAAFIDCLRGQAAGPRLAVLSALFAFAHLPTAVVVAPGYLVLACTLERPDHWHRLVRCALAAGLGLGLAAVYWYPAIALLGSVRSDLLGDSAWALINLFAPVNFARNATVALIWQPFAVMSLVATLALFAARGMAGGLVMASALLLTLSWIMVTPLSLPIWQSDWLRFVQFPWRYLMVADLAFALAALGTAVALGAPGSSRGRRGFAAATLTAMVLVSLGANSLFSGSPASATPVPRMIIFAGAFEWLPRESRQNDFIRLSEWPRVVAAAKSESAHPTIRIDGPGTVKLEEEAPRRLVFGVNLPAPARVVLHRTYWRFWRLENLETGAEVALAPTPRIPLASAILPAGTARYRLELPVLPEERYGALISALALALLLAWAWLSRPRRRS